MRWPLRYQFFLPFAGLLIVAVTTTAATSSYLAVERATRERVRQSQRIVDTLSSTNLPYSDNVLDQMRGLSGGHFVVVGELGGVLASSMEMAEVPESWGVWNEPLHDSPSPEIVQWAAVDYRLAVLELPPRDQRIRVLVLIPEARWQQLQWQAAWPPLAIGSATLVVMLFVSGWLAIRQSRRIHRVQDSLATLARGEEVQLALTQPDDELQDLIRSTNELSRQLSVLQSEIRRTEQLRVLGQLASGLAHQLRNAVAGARLAIQLHLKRHPDQKSASLDTALHQLELTNRQVQSLLALARAEPEHPEWTELTELVDEMLLLVRPNAEHLHVDWREEIQLPEGCLVDRNTMQAALMNLLMNAIEAAGEQGQVQVKARRERDRWMIDIADNGAGVPDSFVDRMFEPFETTKPEGVGIGLTMARTAVEERGGTLTYARRDGHTHFTVTLPGANPQLA